MFSIYSIMSSVNGNSFTLFPIWIPFISFSDLISLRLPNQCLTRVVGVCIINGFQFFTIDFDVSCGLVI